MEVLVHRLKNIMPWFYYKSLILNVGIPFDIAFMSIKTKNMRIAKRLLVIFFLSLPFAGISQQKDTLSNKLDSLSKKTDKAGQQLNNVEPSAYSYRTNLTFKSYFQLLGSDLKQTFTKPFHMNGKDWIRFGGFAAATGVLFFADEPIQRSMVDLTNNNAGVRNTSSFITKFGGVYEIYTLAGFGAYGIIFKSDKVKTTTLLATQAYLTGGAVESVLKYLTGETRPSTYAPGTRARPIFYGPFSKTAKAVNGKNEYSAFPSGHTTVAFAAATVFAKEYSNQIIIPVIAYSAATLIGLSRLTENKHWATDVFAGAFLGYLSGRQVVNNYHRYAKLKAPNQPKSSVSFNMQYNFGRVMPGLVYSLK